MLINELITEEKIVQAAFRDVRTGQIIPAGKMHDIHACFDTTKMNDDQLDQLLDNTECGFLTDTGRFLARGEASKLVQLPPGVNWLHSHHIIPPDSPEEERMQQELKIPTVKNEF